MTRSFAEAVAQSSRPPAPQPPPEVLPPETPTAITIIDTQAGLVDTSSGEILDFTRIDHEFLLDMLDELRRREAQLKTFRIAAEDEAVHRHGDRQAAQPVGEWEVNVERRSTREWDVAELERTLTDLQARGLVDDAARDRLIHIKPVVDGTAAKRFVDHLDGEALDAVRQCFEWKDSRPKVVLTRTTWPGTIALPEG